MKITSCRNKIDVDNYDWFQFVALEGESIVGVCSLLVQFDHANLNSLHVDPSNRRRGIGILLIQSCIAQAKEIESKAVSLSVNKKNNAAIALYQKMGFKSTAEDKDTIWFSIPLNQ